MSSRDRFFKKAASNEELSRLNKAIMCALIAGSLSLSGCGVGTASAQSSSNETTQTAADSTYASLFTDRDKEVGWDEQSTTKIELDGTSARSDSDNVQVETGLVTIKAEGEYVLSGTFSGQIKIAAPEDAKVRLIFNGVTLSNTGSAAIYVLTADKVFITTAKDSENTVAATSAFSATEEDGSAIDATIYSDQDLTLNGQGSLSVSSEAGHAIYAKDSLKVCSGSYSIQAAKSALRAKDLVGILGGTFDISAGTDGIHAEHDDADKGLVYLGGGTINISADSDGIDASGIFHIDAGNLSIGKSEEGIEAKQLEIAGGDISIVSSDDGLNASAGSSDQTASPDAAQEGVSLSISGGKTQINAEGDGIDSNGSLSISGGETYVMGSSNGGNAALDYAGDGQITGGKLIAAGNSGMAQSFGSTSTQAFALVTLDTEVSGQVQLLDSNSSVLLEFNLARKANSILVSSPEMQENGSYSLKTSLGSTNFTLEGLSYGESVQTGFGGPQGQMGGPGQPGTAQGGTPPAKPEEQAEA